MKTMEGVTVKIELLDFDDLLDEEKEGVSNNGRGKESANYIRVTHNGEVLFLENDAWEPEDASFRRDLKWIKDALMACYEAGKAEGAKR